MGIVFQYDSQSCFSDFLKQIGVAEVEVVDGRIESELIEKVGVDSFVIEKLASTDEVSRGLVDDSGSRVVVSTKEGQRIHSLWQRLGMGINEYNPDDYLHVTQTEDRFLFDSAHTGRFWSLGMNCFMDPHNNDPLKEVFEFSDYDSLYEEELGRIIDMGFNTVSGWSDLSNLEDRMPYSIVLFDDDQSEGLAYTAPLIGRNGEAVSVGDSGQPCLIGDPYNESYKIAVEEYIRQRVEPHLDSQSLLNYFIGYEFGFGDSGHGDVNEPIDFSRYLFSDGVKTELLQWLQARYANISALNAEWETSYVSFAEAVQGQDPQTQMGRDVLRTFAVKVASDWFALVTGLIRKHDPHHLISSPKLSVYPKAGLSTAMEWGHFKAFQGHFDFVSIDFYSGEPEYPEKVMQELEDIHQELGMPILVAEFGTRQKRFGWNNRPGAKAHVRTQSQRGLRYKTQTSQLFENSFIIGAHWFRWQDHLTEKHQHNKGVVRVRGNRIVSYHALSRTMARQNRRIEKWVQKE